jgi:hypothetical protein
VTTDPTLNARDALLASAREHVRSRGGGEGHNGHLC